jgi:hypothetical protein
MQLSPRTVYRALVSQFDLLRFPPLLNFSPLTNPLFPVLNNTASGSRTQIRKGITRMFNVILPIANAVAWFSLALIVSEHAGRFLGQMAARLEWEWR